jgi:hypothetical protein
MRQKLLAALLVTRLLLVYLILRVVEFVFHVHVESPDPHNPAAIVPCGRTWWAVDLSLTPPIRPKRLWRNALYEVRYQASKRSLDRRADLAWRKL